MRRWAGRAAGAGAALAWVILCARWFDVGQPRAPWLAAVPPGLLAVAALGLLAVWLGARRPGWAGPRREGPRGGLLLVVGLAVLFRLPLAWQGAAGYLTPDGALSGLVALHLREGIERLVFVPHVPYSGSLKSHLAAPLSLGMDTARAFAVSSILFYALFVAALYRLALRLREAPAWTAVAAGLYAAFAPAFVTHYSLSNDGNYVEVLALGTWALLLAVRWADEPERRRLLALATGLVLGLAFWCHILAVVHAAAIAAFLMVSGPKAALRSAPAAVGGLALGAAPSLAWNAANGWGSFRYLLPGGPGVGATDEGPGLARRATAMATDLGPVLLGYDAGYPPVVDGLFRLLAWAAVVAALAGFVAAARRAVDGREPVLRLLVLFSVVNVTVALLALPYIPGNPRYLLFLMAAVPILLAHLLRGRVARPAFALLVAFGAVGSVAQAPGAFASDARWRAFVAGLEGAGVRWCHTDFYLATKINFLSEERVTCSAKLGPTTTEYFFEYRDRVERAPEAALIAVNETSADKLARRLDRLGVAFERRDLMKPVLLRLSRKVDPAELFPDRDFPLR